MSESTIDEHACNICHRCLRTMIFEYVREPVEAKENGIKPIPKYNRNPLIDSVIFAPENEPIFAVILWL
jgi:hypothetical protein